MKISPITSRTLVLACTEAPHVRYLRDNGNGHFTAVTSVTKATTYETEEEARDAFARYAVRPRGAFSGGSTWDVFEVTTKISFAQVKQPADRAGNAPAEAGAPR